MIAKTKPTLDDKISEQQKRAELAKLKVDEVNSKTQLRIARSADRLVRMKYDATDVRYATSRKKVSREKSNEDGIQSPTERLSGVAVGRDLRRNCSTYKTIEGQLQACVVGTGPKVQFNTDDDQWNELAATWFNSDWAKWCDGVDDSPLSDQISVAYSYTIREGDVLCVFDDFQRADGTLRWFEPDQLVSIQDQDWELQATKRGFAWKEKNPLDGRKTIPMTQSNGVVRDSFGRVHAYVVTNKTGITVAEFKDVTIIPRWDAQNNPNGSAKLLKFPWRFNQTRGTADSLTIANEQRDIFEMRNAELASAKKAAQYFATIETDAEGESGIIRALQKGNLTPEEIDQILYGEDGSSTSVTGVQYDALEGSFGARMEYLDPGDKMNIHSTDRPSSDVSDFSERTQVSSGAALGLGRSRSLLKAESSYTAFRGEELMTWQTSQIAQKGLERRLMDFLIFKSVGFALSKGLLPKSNEPLWWKRASFSWPAMREVDEVRTANAERIFIKNGSRNLTDSLGPDWKNKMEQSVQVANEARALNLPLSIFETVSGSIIEEKEENNEQ